MSLGRPNRSPDLSPGCLREHTRTQCRGRVIRRRPGLAHRPSSISHRAAPRKRPACHGRRLNSLKSVIFTAAAMTSLSQRIWIENMATGGSALAYNSSQRRSDRRFFALTFMSGHPTDNDTAPSSGSLTPVSRKDAAKNEIKVGRGLSFLFSLLKMDPGLTLLSASPSPSVIERLCVCWASVVAVCR